MKPHRIAYRCRDSEATRRFYEEFLGLPLAAAQEFRKSLTGRPAQTLHTFYRLADDSFIAFFEHADLEFDFKPRHAFDLHLALEVEPDLLPSMLAKARAAGIEARGRSDHGFIDSIYLRDPNGYVVELCARRQRHDASMDPARSGAQATLDRWSATRALLA